MKEQITKEAAYDHLIRKCRIKLLKKALVLFTVIPVLFVAVCAICHVEVPFLFLDLVSRSSANAMIFYICLTSLGIVASFLVTGVIFPIDYTASIWEELSSSYQQKLIEKQDEKMRWL